VARGRLTARLPKECCEEHPSKALCKTLPPSTPKSAGKFLQKEGSFAKEGLFYNRDLALERSSCVKHYFCKRRALQQKKGSVSLALERT